MLAVWKPTAISTKAIRGVVAMFIPSSTPQAGGNGPHGFQFHTLMVNNHPNKITTLVLVRLEAMDLHKPYCVWVILKAWLAYFVLPGSPILLDINTILGHLGL